MRELDVGSKDAQWYIDFQKHQKLSKPKVRYGWKCGRGERQLGALALCRNRRKQGNVASFSLAGSSQNVNEGAWRWVKGRAVVHRLPEAQEAVEAKGTLRLEVRER